MTTIHKTTSVLMGLILMSALVGVALAVGECSSSNPCKGGECCSQFGICGCSDAYCVQGCIDNCNGCGGRRATSADSGQATYYTTYVPSSCYGLDTSKFPGGNMIAAASTDVFGNRAACGTYYEITCKGTTSGGRNPCKNNPTVKVMVVDVCPTCNKKSFDLSKEAFSKIADLDAGRINISAKRVSKYHKTDEEDITEVVLTKCILVPLGNSLRIARPLQDTRHPRVMAVNNVECGTALNGRKCVYIAAVYNKRSLYMILG